MCRPILRSLQFSFTSCRGHLKCDGTRAQNRFRLSAKRTSPFKSAGTSVQSTTGSRDVRIRGSIAEYTMFRGSVKSTGYPLHSPVSPSLPLPCVTVRRHISTGLYIAIHIAIPLQYSLIRIPNLHVAGNKPVAVRLPGNKGIAPVINKT
jgi:hypothetical protein